MIQSAYGDFGQARINALWEESQELGKEVEWRELEYGSKDYAQCVIKELCSLMRRISISTEDPAEYVDGFVKVNHDVLQNGEEHEQGQKEFAKGVLCVIEGRPMVDGLSGKRKIAFENGRTSAKAIMEMKEFFKDGNLDPADRVVAEWASRMGLDEETGSDIRNNSLALDAYMKLLLACVRYLKSHLRCYFFNDTTPHPEEVDMDVDRLLAITKDGKETSMFMEVIEHYVDSSMQIRDRIDYSNSGIEEVGILRQQLQKGILKNLAAKGALLYGGKKWGMVAIACFELLCLEVEGAANVDAPRFIDEITGDVSDSSRRIGNVRMATVNGIVRSYSRGNRIEQQDDDIASDEVAETANYTIYIGAHGLGSHIADRCPPD